MQPLSERNCPGMVHLVVTWRGTSISKGSRGLFKAIHFRHSTKCNFNENTALHYAQGLLPIKYSRILANKIAENPYFQSATADEENTAIPSAAQNSRNERASSSSTPKPVLI